MLSLSVVHTVMSMSGRICSHCNLSQVQKQVSTTSRPFAGMHRSLPASFSRLQDTRAVTTQEINQWTTYMECSKYSSDFKCIWYTSLISHANLRSSFKQCSSPRIGLKESALLRCTGCVTFPLRVRTEDHTNIIQACKKYQEISGRYQEI